MIVWMATLAIAAFSQPSPSPSPLVLNLKTFIGDIKKNHPLAKLAQIQVEKAKAESLIAKGAFDPNLALEASRKTFNGKNYYYYANPQLKIPLPIGDVKAGLEDNGGSFLSTEASAGQSSYLGIEVPLLKGLMMDKRRAALQQAKLFQLQSEQEQIKMINNLMLDAYTTYWQWAAAYQLFQIYTQYSSISQDRLKLVKLGFAGGDRSAMDTTEAYLQVLNYEMVKANALQILNDVRLDISQFIWDDSATPYLLAETILPDTTLLADTFTTPNIEAILAKGLAQHPDLSIYQFKLKSLAVEKRLKFQSLLPTANLQANLLNKNYYVLKNWGSSLLENNYKWGISIKIPLLWREARGDYQLVKLKTQETQLNWLQKNREVELKIRSYYNDFTQLQHQLNIAKEAYKNYQILLRNETMRFVNGESSLFLVNNRELKTLETLEKIVTLQVKFAKARYAIDWAAGQLQ